MRRSLEIAYEAMLDHGASQVPEELADAFLLVEALKPKTLVEIGCDRGGTLWVWRKCAERVIGVTLRDNADSGGRPLIDHGCEIIFGDSHDEATKTRLINLLGQDDIDLLVIDGDHSWEGVQADYEMYSPLVSDDGLIMLHDAVHEYFPDVGRFFADYCEGFIIQHSPNPAGWAITGNQSTVRAVWQRREEVQRMVDAERVSEAVAAMRRAQARYGRNPTVISIEDWLTEHGYDFDGEPVKRQEKAAPAERADRAAPVDRQAPKRQTTKATL